MTMTLKQWIEAEQLTQRQAAKRLKVDAPTLSRWLSGRFRPNLDRAYAVQKATDDAVPMWIWVAKKPPCRPKPNAATPEMARVLQAIVADDERGHIPATRHVDAARAALTATAKLTPASDS